MCFMLCEFCPCFHVTPGISFKGKIQCRNSCCLLYHSFYYISFAKRLDLLYFILGILSGDLGLFFISLSHKTRLLYTTRQFHSMQIKVFFLFQFNHFGMYCNSFYPIFSLIQLSLSFTLQGEEENAV